MKKSPRLSPDFSELRRLAEEKFNQRQAHEGPRLTVSDLSRLVHELQVHEIELVMQNDELVKTRAELESLLKRYTDLYDHAPVGYLTLTKDGTVKQINIRGAQILGYEREQLFGSRFGLFVGEDSLVQFNTFLANVFASHVKQVCEVELQKSYTEPLWAQMEAISDEGTTDCRVVMIDIHARKQAEIKLQFISMHDALTGLYNRSYFEESIKRLEGGRHFPISILIADVDRLKTVNDRLGHAVGDAILKRVAQVLTLVFRSEDVIARIGGDEFAVLLPDTNQDAAEIALRRLHAFLQEHNTNHFTEVPLKLSVGTATAEPGELLLETLKAADANMYKQKQG